MKNFKIFIAIVVGVTIFFMVEFSKINGVKTMKITEYIKTKEPMLLSAEGKQEYFHVLPTGAALYKFQSFPEGHTTYIAYINIKGSFEYERARSEYSVDPMWAFPIHPEQVKILVEKTPISKEDLVHILKARKMTRADLAEIVRDWKDD